MNKIIIYITRHGETIENKKNIIQGWLPGKLSEDGLSKTIEFANKIKNKKFDIIYSSDLNRSKQTTKEIIKIMKKNTSVLYTKLLREISAGIYDGIKSDNEKFIEFKKRRNSDNFYKPKNGESINDIYNRLEKFKNKIIKENKNQSILIVSHGMSSIILYSIFKNLKINNINWDIKIESYKLKKITINI